ncbi:MAG: hypothetical protein IIA73_04375 [Proteobacteria bacterium]|nr:hypothetical protein [Pseudomonadota bacterium]
MDQKGRRMTDPAEDLLERAKARFPDLTAPEEMLVRKAASGEVADFAGEDEKPTLRAEVLAWLAADPAATEHVHHKGVQLGGANIEGTLDLNHADLPHPLVLVNCVVEKGINLRHARARAVHLVDGTVTGEILAEGLHVEGSLFFRNGFHAKGGVRLLGAEIGGEFNCTGSRFENPKGIALNAERMRVRGTVFLNEKFHAEGEVRLDSAEVGGELVCNGGRFENPGRTALWADGARVQGSVFLRDRFAAEGEVRLVGSEVGGNLECTGGTFKNSDGDALSFDVARVRGNVFLRNVVAKGVVRLLRAEVGGILGCEGGRFENAGGNALRADGARIGGEFLLRNVVAKGVVRLLGAEVGGNLDCNGAKFDNPGGNALSADGARIRGDVLLRNGFVAKGVVRLPGAVVGGDLACARGKFENPHGDALVANRARVRGTIFLRNGFVAEGAVRLLGAEVGGDIECTNGKFHDPEGDALDLGGAQVAGALHLHDFSERIAGRVSLRSAAVGELADDANSWPEPGELALDGFTYNHLAGKAPRSAEQRLKWIARQSRDEFSTQPYEQLAKVLRRMGLEHEARRVAIAKQQALRARFPLWRLPWSLFLDVTIGYGYRPWRAVLWLIGLWVIGWAYLHGIDFSGAVCATKVSPYCGSTPTGYPELVPTRYALDMLLPFLDLSQQIYWEPDPTSHLGAKLGRLQWLYTGLGWLFSILAAVGFSGILRKD